jgi:hypothetical protein
VRIVGCSAAKGVAPSIPQRVDLDRLRELPAVYPLAPTEQVDALYRIAGRPRFHNALPQADGL